MSESSDDMNSLTKNSARSTLDFALSAALALSATTITWSTFQVWNNRSDLEQVRRQDLQAASLIAEVRHLRSLPVIV